MPTHDISRQSENPYSDGAVAKRRRWDNHADSDRQTHNLERVENQVDRRHVKGRDFRNESAPKKVSITLQQSNSGAKKTSENNGLPMPPSASIAAALVSGTSNFHLATLGRIPIDSENANITATKTNGSGKQIDNAMGALSVLESRWSSSQQKGPPPGPGKNSKKNKKRKRKKKILNDAINENMTNKAPIVVIKEPEPVTAVAPAAEQNRGGSRHEAIDLTSPDGGRESERAKCDHNGDLISSKEVQLTYASVLKKASDQDSVPIPTESPAPDITKDNHNSTFEERNRVLRKESVDDEMDISDEEEEESNGNTVANNDEATSKSVESLYEDLPNDLLTDRINSCSNVAKLESQLLDSKSNIAAPTDSTGTNQAINDASKLSEKERRTLKLAELRAKAKLASAKLRMAMQRKARGNASNELGDTKTDADHLTHRTFGLPSQRSVQNSLQNFKPLSVPPTSTKLPDITAMSQKFNLIIPDVALTGPANKVRFVDSVYELSSDDNDDDDGMKGGYQLLDEILDKGTEADLPSSSTETNNSSTISPIDPQEIKSLHPKGGISELNENQKKSESLKQQLNLAKLRLELKKKQQLLLAKKKLSQESSNAPSLEDKREVDCTIGSLMDPKQESTIEQRRILLHKLREKEQALLARKQRLLTGDTPTNNETIDHPVEKSISSDVEVGESKNTSVPKSIDEKSVEPAQGSISAISETLEPLPSLEQKHEKLEQLRRRQRELKQRNEVSNLRNLIMRQRDLLRAQGQELIESSSQLEACTNEIMSKQSMLEASEQRLQEMNHRKRIIEGMVFRATEKLMASRKALNQRKQELNTK